MHTKPRYGASIEKLVLHDPEGANTARELYNYLENISAGYHAMVDNGELIIAATDDLIVEGAGGMNTHALHICFVPGRAAWSRDEWLQHLPAIKLGAGWLAAKCKQYGIPARHLTPQEVATPGAKGICTHGDVTYAGFTASEGHTDPGLNFPLDVLLDAVNAILNPQPTFHLEPTMIVQTHWYDEHGKAIAIPTKTADGKHYRVARILPAQDGGCVECRAGSNIVGSVDPAHTQIRKFVPDDLGSAKVVSVAAWTPSDGTVPGVWVQYSDGRGKPVRFADQP